MADMNTLTERQREIYDFIEDKIETRRYGPTVREIGDAFDIKSPNGVMCHLKALEKKGLIKREEGLARSIQLVSHKSQAPGLPLLGSVAAGSPMQAIETDDRLDFQQLLCGPGHYALRVKGQSMIEDHIDDGDFVVIRKQETADNGQRVVAMINGEVTLKKFYRKKDQIKLEPANEKMDPIILNPGDDNKVIGILVGVIRRC